MEEFVSGRYDFFLVGVGVRNLVIMWEWVVSINDVCSSVGFSVFSILGFTLFCVK